ncbi:DUF881 domain-containing protein [Isoptericola sp. F-RaC21]|uniref:DUF881 domain-containing protein n=1 Tax=Isoptericola sp. F-RaC21 TaxID=3141452 RepID=UPI00315C1628
MSDPRDDRPENPDAPDAASGQDDDVTTGTPDPVTPDDGAGTSASAEQEDGAEAGREEAPDAAGEQPDAPQGPASPEEPGPVADAADTQVTETTAQDVADGAPSPDDDPQDDDPQDDTPQDDTVPGGDPGTGEESRAEADDTREDDDEVPADVDASDGVGPVAEPSPVDTDTEPADRGPEQDVPGTLPEAAEVNEPEADALPPDPAEAGTEPRTSEASTATGAAAADAPSGWRRLGAALRPRASRSQVLAGVLCAALGFALVVQVQQSASDQLSSARQEDLVRLLDEVTDRAQQLGDEVSGLEATRDELESGSGQARSALELAQQRAESEGILSGRLPAQGPGVRVTIQDPAGALKASQMFNVLEELRNAGAEVVELNGVRLVTSTWFEDKGDAIVVDGTTLTSPYEWTVVGDPETLDRALEIPGGALATVRTAGAEASTAREDEVKITAVTPPGEPEYAQPEREHD